jgi:CBS domain containing-hemolysin-like protein
MEKRVFPFQQSGRFLMTRRTVLTLLCLLAVVLTTTMVMAADGNDPAGSYRVAADLTPMLLYLTLALGVSFLCSILEAVLLSVGPGHVQVMIDSGLQSGLVLKKLRDDLDRSLSAILTLNTIAHTVGAAGVGAEVADKFGDSYLGLASALLTLLVLVLSEVIPKTLGARHCRPLAGKSAILIRWLSLMLFPVVVALQWFSTLLFGELEQGSFSRRELIAITRLAEKQGQLEDDESEMVQNLLQLRKIKVSGIMTPTTVIVTLAEESTVAEAVEQKMPIHHSRIPLTRESNTIRTYLLYTDLLETQLTGDREKLLAALSRPIRTIHENSPVYDAMKILIENRDKILLVVNEFGEELGIVTDEDVLEAIAGREIIDEEDEHVSLRDKAAQQWKKSQAEDSGRTDTEPEES